MKSRSVVVILIVAALLAVCVGASATRSDARLLAPVNDDELNAFDKVVQQRFHDVIGFGMARISSQRWFVPETVEEKEAVKGLKRAGYGLCLFLVGRGVLQNVPEDRRVSHAYFGGFGDHTISGPVFLKKHETMRGLPAAIEMWEPSRQAFQTFANDGARYDFQIRDWKIEARPVRAGDESCLRCHGHDTRLTYHSDGSYLIEPNAESNKVQVGDTVGILLYVYKKKSDKP
jgi:hypothetical protein